MTTLSPLPPTPTPEPSEEKQPAKAVKKPLSPIVKALWRPVLALAIIVHAFLLFIPLEKPKPKPSPTASPIDKNVKIDRVSLVKKSAPTPQAKPRPKTNRRPKTNIKPAVRSRTAPAPRQSPQPNEPPLDDFDDSIPTDPSPTGDGKPGDGKPSEPTAGYGVDLCALGDVLSDLGAEAAEGTGGPRPEDFRQAGLYYTPDGQFKPEVGDVVKVTIYRETDAVTDTGVGVSARRDADYVRGRLSDSCKKNGATFSLREALGDGDLYVIAKGGSAAYISIVKGTTVSASIFIVAWNGDPTKKP